MIDLATVAGYAASLTAIGLPIIGVGKLAWDKGIRPAYKAINEAIDNSRVVRAQVLPNGGSSMRDDLTKLADRVIAMDRDLSRCVGAVDLQVEISPIPQFRTDTNGDCILVNRAWVEFTGKDLHEMVGRNGMNIVAPVDRQRVFEAWEHAIEQARHFEEDYFAIRKDGSLTPVRARAIAQKNSTGQFVGHAGRLQIM